PVVKDADPPPSGDRFLWLALAACASVLLLAVTSPLTQNFSPIPFLWILPLSLYLLSFIVCFEAPRFYRRIVFLPLLAAALAFMGRQLSPYHGDLPMRLNIAGFAAGLFICCMVCHGELVRVRPHPQYLTG